MTTEQKKISFAVIGIGILIIIIQVINDPSVRTRDASQPTKSPGGDSAASESTTNRTKWQVINGQSKLDDSATVGLSLQANNEIEGWLKRYRPTLNIRCMENTTNLYIDVGMASSVESGDLEGHTIRYRLQRNGSKEKPVVLSQTWKESTNNEALFAPNAIAFARQLAGADKLFFAFIPFNANPATIEFDVSGLAQLLSQVGDACNWAAYDRRQSAVKSVKATRLAKAAAEVEPCRKESNANRWCWHNADDSFYNSELASWDSKDAAIRHAIEVLDVTGGGIQ